MNQSFGFAQDRPFGKHLVWEFWQRLDAATPDALPDIVAPYLADDVAWTGFHPFNQLDGREAVVGGWWQPLRAAFPDVRRDTYILLGGSFAGKDWVSATGCFVGTFVRDWVGIPATGQQASIRFGEFCAVKDGRIVEDYMLLDLVDLMRQSGYRVLPPSPGDETYWPRPFGAEGVLLSAQDEAESLKSLRLVEAMIGGLGKYDGTDAGKMGQTAFWSQQMHWYGPCGIGSSRNRQEYERNHQTPFLTAFPDRKGFTHPDGGTHKARIAEGNFVASTGWPSVRATHLGEYLGYPATGKPISMRVADWWRREDDVLVQNWVFIDLPDLFMQFGVDLFARLRQQTQK
jgi:predicted ester cyclase